MAELAGELIPIVQFLLPGFLITTIFYWLSDAPKPGQFERTLQALIGTALISLVNPYLEQGLKWIGENYYSLGPWTSSSPMALSVTLAIIAGLLLALAANHDTLYYVARALKLTTRASHSEWIYAFRTRPGRWVVIHFLDGRRLIGYPEAWPTNPEAGYFLLQSPRWVKEDGSHYDDQGISCMLVKSSDVYWVEILNAQESNDDESEKTKQWWQFWKSHSCE
ncbi:DUF6338 family protein [Pseudomonas aeruginosa]|uniref:DUF6338 family protein n=1 Tax=Pseudomonas aeruginosa TaxID=287 RepID=UPI0005C6D1AD|nr:DUF6338 family protein [Pseudomonas aeruginosa]EMB0054118.1 hypothetical protein [Pseudomonas aeruginosa]MCG3059104.1 DUF6338 family protein [Pseudomonas aeruginosa]MCG3070188.1 DUF6338 family protein [Pseudomonas aeruginosa]MCG3082099.1 DUF6338 family protein [Pseudomonas aeruginosa]MCV0166683.1 hypothetical protein [Pseudomonas aeruginosa]